MTDVTEEVALESEQPTDAQQDKQDKKGELKFTDSDMASLRKRYERKLTEQQSSHETVLAEQTETVKSLQKFVRETVINVVTAGMAPNEKRLFDKLTFEEQLAEIQSEDFQKNMKSQVRTPTPPQSPTEKPVRQVTPGR